MSEWLTSGVWPKTPHASLGVSLEFEDSGDWYWCLQVDCYRILNAVINLRRDNAIAFSLGTHLQRRLQYLVNGFVGLFVFLLALKAVRHNNTNSVRGTRARG